MLDMPSHGYFIPGQPRMNEEQIIELVDIINNSERNWRLEELVKIIKDKYDLGYSPEQVYNTFSNFLNFG